MGRKKKNEYDSTEEVVEEVEETVEEETVDPEETAEVLEEEVLSEEEALVSDEVVEETVVEEEVAEEPVVEEPVVEEPVVQEPVVQEPVQEEVKVAIPVQEVEAYVVRCVVCKHTQIEKKPIEHVTCAACGSGNVKVR